MSVIRAVPFGTVIHRKKKKNACLLDTYEKLRLCKYEFVNRYNYYDLHVFSREPFDRSQPSYDPVVGLGSEREQFPQL